MYARKFLHFCAGWLKRSMDLFRALSCDVIFVHLEAFPIGPPVIEWCLAKAGKKIIYDLDDAIYLGAASRTNIVINKMKCPWKIPKIIGLSRHVITCNEHLADYSLRFNTKVTVIHTSVDTDRFKPPVNAPSDDITIGWIGSHSTAKYLESLKGVFLKLASRGYRFRINIIGASQKVFDIPGVEVIYKDWKLDEEISEFQSLDICVYPLPDNEWTAGKTGFKTIQYMSVGVPCVVSDVSPNRIIVKEGINGFLAKDDDEWEKKISMLMDDAEMRRRIGHAGRQAVMENYSLKVNAPKLLCIIEKVYKDG
jgi:glycosyltransferase involved in cell wall biosynthesis